MINARIDDRKAAPAWAAIGAPLIGIPVLVGLLALATPHRETVERDPAAVTGTEAATVVTAEPFEPYDPAEHGPWCEVEHEPTTVEGRRMPAGSPW